MGATNFVTGAVAGDSCNDAYNRAVKESVREHGDDPYSGTIATTNGVYEAVRSPMTVSGANVYAGAMWETTHKWEASAAVPVAEDKHFTFRKVKFTVEVPTTDEYGHPATEWDVRDAAMEKAVAQFGSSIHTVAVAPKVKTKIVVENATGRPVTKYQVTGGHVRTAVYDTKTAAVAAAKKVVGDRSGTQVSIQAVKIYPDTGSATVTVRSVTVEAKATVTVTVATPKKPGQTPVSGWIFFGTAAI